MSENITNNPSVPSQIVSEVKFPRFINNLGIIPTSYKDSMSYYETLAWLCNYLEKTVIPTVNQNGGAVQELQGLYIQLNDYVTHYFDNLDVQEEINNKLDSMAQDGTLDEIINQEIFGDLNDEIDNIKNNTIGNLENLTTLNNDSLVESINTNNQLNEVYLGNGIVYDIPETTGHVQGSCIHENILYVAVQDDGTYGYLYLFNIVTNTFISKISNVKMYHGNDLTYLNNKIYIASVDNLNVCIYDLSTNTSSEITPFSELTSNYNELVGVEKLDENNILCWLKNTTGTNSIATDKFVKLNVNSMQYEDFSIVDTYNILKANGSITRQNLTIDGNVLYILMQVPQLIYKADIENMNLNFNKIYNLPAKDQNYNPISEYESLAIINNENYPTGSIMLTCRTYQTMKDLNVQYTKETIVNYFLSPKSGNASYVISHPNFYAQRPNNNFGYTSVSKSVGNLLECGSATYPYKDLIRGINSVINGKYAPTILQIIDSSDYYLPFLYGINNVEIMVQNNCNPTIYIGDIENCNIKFTTTGNGTLTIKPIATNKRSTFALSKILFYGNNSNSIIFNNIQLVFNECSYISTRRTKWNNTETVSSGYAVQVFDGSMFIDCFDTRTLAGSDKWAYVTNCSIIGTSSNDVTKGGTSAIISMTN